MPKGFPVEVVEELGEWSKVKAMDFASGRLVEGWAAKVYLKEGLDDLDTEAEEQ